jgi:hypothetical protein
MRSDWLEKRGFEKVFEVVEATVGFGVGLTPVLISHPDRR